MGYFQFISGFWQSKQRIIIQVQSIHYIYPLMISWKTHQICFSFATFSGGPGACPQTPQFSRPFGPIFATRRSLTELYLKT